MLGFCPPLLGPRDPLGSSDSSLPRGSCACRISVISWGRGGEPRVLLVSWYTPGASRVVRPLASVGAPLVTSGGFCFTGVPTKLWPGRSGFPFLGKISFPVCPRGAVRCILPSMMGHATIHVTPLPGPVLDRDGWEEGWRESDLAVEWDTRLKRQGDGVTAITRIITPAEAIYWHLDLVRRGRWNHESREIAVTLYDDLTDLGTSPFKGEIVSMRAPDYWDDQASPGKRHDSSPWRSQQILFCRTDLGIPDINYVLIQTHHIKEIRWTPNLWEHF